MLFADRLKMAQKEINSKVELITEIAYLYYEMHYTQIKIGQVMKLSNATVSRLLKEARESNLVEIKIKYPTIRDSSLEESLKEIFHLKNARVLSTSNLSYASLIKRVGQLAARLLELYLKDNMTLAVSWGQSVRSTVEALHASKPLNIRVVQAQGVFTNEMIEGSETVRRLSDLYGNNSLVIHSPLILKDKEICKILLTEPSIKKVISVAENADIALVGIGSIHPGASNFLQNNLLAEEDLEKLAQEGVVGDICGKHFNHRGEILDNDLNQRVVSINIEKLRDIPLVIGVVAGKWKNEAALAALRGHYINMLVTDSEIARFLVHEND